MTATGQLTADGKKVIQRRLQAKIFAYQDLSMLSDDAHKVIGRQSEEYTWTDATGLNEEMDDMTILALILQCLQPHNKVNMYSKIGAIKQITIAQYDNDINLFFDSIKSVKLQIDSKDPMPMAYTDQASVRDMFVQLKNDCFRMTLRLGLLLLRGVGRWTRRL